MTITTKLVQFEKERETREIREVYSTPAPTFGYAGIMDGGMGQAMMDFVYDPFYDERNARIREYEGKRFRPNERQKRQFPALKTLQEYQDEIVAMLRADDFNIVNFRALLRQDYYYPYSDQTRIVIEPNDYREPHRECWELFKYAECKSCPVLEAMVRDRAAYLAIEQIAKDHGRLQELKSGFEFNKDWGDTNFSGLDLTGVKFVGSLQDARFYEDDAEQGYRSETIIHDADFSEADARLAKITFPQINDGSIQKNLMKIPQYCSPESAAKLRVQIKKLDDYGQKLIDIGVPEKGKAAKELAGRLTAKLDGPSFKKDLPSFRQEFLSLADDPKYTFFKDKRNHSARQIFSTMALILGTGIVPGLLAVGIYALVTRKAPFSNTTTQNRVEGIVRAAKRARPVRT